MHQIKIDYHVIIANIMRILHFFALIILYLLLQHILIMHLIIENNENNFTEKKIYHQIQLRDVESSHCSFVQKLALLFSAH